ncbi:MAG TPA: four helix bundle protein [Planctomycetaceae bacterium]|nr:four helix bundle protein [Planctomycetaceae bacterium]
MQREKLTFQHGGYRRLKSFRMAQLVYDLTVRFCDRYVDRFSRTRDQMVQAARSGVQNIAEGSQASGTSKKTEIQLTQVARASLEELKLDYEDFLRHRRLPCWDRHDRRRQALVDRRCTTADEVAVWIVEQVREQRLGRRSGPSGHSRHSGPSGRDRGRWAVGRRNEKSSASEGVGDSAVSRAALYAEYSANAALVLIAVATFLLDRQIEALGRQFEREGGFTERLYRRRASTRRLQPD